MDCVTLALEFESKRFIEVLSKKKLKKSKLNSAVWIHRSGGGDAQKHTPKLSPRRQALLFRDR